jgi:hypothetical protein
VCEALRGIDEWKPQVVVRFWSFSMLSCNYLSVDKLWRGEMEGTKESDKRKARCEESYRREEGLSWGV